MPETFYKNDYKWKKDLKDFVTKNPIGKLTKPVLRILYRLLEPYIPEQRDFLLRRVKKHGTYCEVGVYEGKLSQRIKRICKPQKLYLVDPWQAISGRDEKKYNQVSQDQRLITVQNRFDKDIAGGTVIIVRQTSDEAVRLFQDDMFDFVYIDGDHSFSQVQKDLDNYYPKVKKNGLLCGDDYHIDEVSKAVGIFAQKHGLRIEVKNRQFIIQK